MHVLTLAYMMVRVLLYTQAKKAQQAEQAQQEQLAAKKEAEARNKKFSTDYSRFDDIDTSEEETNPADGSNDNEQGEKTDALLRAGAAAGKFDGAAAGTAGSRAGPSPCAGGLAPPRPRRADRQTDRQTDMTAQRVHSADGRGRRTTTTNHAQHTRATRQKPCSARMQQPRRRQRQRRRQAGFHQISGY